MSERDAGAVTRRVWIWVVVGVLVVAALIVAFLTTRGAGGGNPAAAPTPTVSDAGTDNPTSIPVLPSETAVPFDTPAPVADGVSATVSGFEAVTSESKEVGEIAGPSLRFTLTIVNDSAAPISLATALVNVYYDADQKPSQDMSNPGVVPLPDELAAGATATAVLVFDVPEDHRDDLLITLDYQPGSELVAFSGSAKGA